MVIMTPEEFGRLKTLLPEGQRLKLMINEDELGDYEVIFRPVRNKDTGMVTFAWGVNIDNTESYIVGDRSTLTVVHPVNLAFLKGLKD